MRNRLVRAGLLFCASAAAVGSLVMFASRTLSQSTPIEPRAKAAKIASAPTKKLSFNDDIQPILSEHCFQCHGPDSGSRKGELRLDRPEFAFLPRKEGGGFAIVKGDPSKSLLVRRITAANPKDIMPPPEAHKELRAGEIALLQRWI